MVLSSLPSAAIALVVTDSIKGTRQERLIRRKHRRRLKKDLTRFRDRYSTTQEYNESKPFKVLCPTKDSALLATKGRYTFGATRILPLRHNDEDQITSVYEGSMCFI